MSTPALPPEHWYKTVIEVMLEDNVPFATAAPLCGISDLTAKDVSDHTRRRAFREMYEEMSRSFHERQGTTDAATKSRLVGEMLADARNLRRAGRLKESADITASAAKVLGYTGPETSISFWDSLTGLNIEELQKRFPMKAPDPPAKTVQ